MTSPATDGPEPVFALAGASYAYAGGVTALDAVTISIAAGERVVVLGANGSGKSTLIKLLDGLLFAQAGCVEAFGEPLTEAAMRDDRLAHRFRRRVGFIFQNADAQLFSSTVREEIAFGPLQLGLPPDDIESRTAEIARLMEIEKLLGRAPYQLSGGEKRKVAIASSLVISPDVLLLDEPATGLDPRSQYWLVQLLRRLHEAGKTLIMATHDLAIAPDIADRAIVFAEDHRVAADAPVSAVLGDTGLLLRVNLVHEHWHRHGTLVHTHPHPHDRPHVHPGEPESQP
ncbi:MAG TPA: ABC transporter ATP-binding protein [Chthonomonadaceae bacterium]|nr:ABC transporter ATP-binding protein [Chthonomonadaceae bacterium]